MGRSNSFQAWRRHWILTTVLVLLALAATAVAVVRGPRTYQAQGAVTLLASRAVTKAAGSNNPYLSFSGSLTLTADVLSRELMAPGTVSSLAARGFPDTYTVALATYTTTTTGSVLTVAVTGSDQAGVERDLGGVMTEIQDKLAGLQAGIKPFNRIRIVTIAESQQATISVSSTARPLTLVAAGGLLFAFGLPWLVDAQLMSRRARRARARLDAGQAEVDDPAGEGEDWAAGEPGLSSTRLYPQFAPRQTARPGSRGAGGAR